MSSPPALRSPRRGSRLVVGIDVEHTDQPRADHDLQQLVQVLPAGAVSVAATHWAHLGDRPHVALSLELVDAFADVLMGPLAELAPRWSLALDGETVGDAALGAAAQEARTAHVQRRRGRLVHFPGVEQLVGTMTVQELLDRSAVDRVRVLTAGEAEPDVRVVTRNHVRPTWLDGELVLLTQPAVGGTVVPFESPSPTACCADH